MLFDFFGTLTRAVHRGPAHAGIARSLGCDPDAFAAALDRTYYLRASGMYGPPAEALRRIAVELGARPEPDMIANAVRARVRAVAADTSLRTGAAVVLRLLRLRGLRIAVVSDCWYELPQFFPTLPIAPLVDACAFSIEVGRCKPDPAMYLSACDQLGVRPEHCLYVGDGGSHELTGATSVGMTAVRLETADLAGHLAFNRDSAWVGLLVRSLPDVLTVVDGVPALT